MALEDYKVPASKEEAQKRKEEVADIIAKYNEAEFNGTEFPCTEEELDDYMEEYEILTAHLKLTKEEKHQMKAKYDEEGNEIIDDGFFTKVKVLPAILMCLLTLLSCFACLLGSSIKDSAMDKIINEAFQGGLNDNLTTLIGSQYEISGFKFFFTLTISFFGPCLGVIILSLVVYFIFRNKTPETKKFLTIMLIANIAIALIWCGIYYGVKVLPDAIEVWDVLDENYYYTYLYSLYYSSYGY